MDAIKLFKGYDQVNPQEDQTSPRNSSPRKPLVTVAISFLVISTVIVAATIGTLIHKPNTQTQTLASSPPSTDPAESVRAVCSVTRYPDSCFASMASLDSSRFGMLKPDPELIFNASLRVAIDGLANLSSLPQALISTSNDPRTESALRDCQDLLESAASQLGRAASSMEVGPGASVLTEAKIGDMRTWISGAMTDQETCLDGLEEMGSTVLDEARTVMQKSNQYTSNALAILSNIKALLRKCDLTMH